MDRHDDLVVTVTPLIDTLDRPGVARYVGGAVVSTAPRTEYLRRWAAVLRIDDLLERALVDTRERRQRQTWRRRRDEDTNACY